MTAVVFPYVLTMQQTWILTIKPVNMHLHNRNLIMQSSHNVLSILRPYVLLTIAPVGPSAPLSPC